MTNRVFASDRRQPLATIDPITDRSRPDVFAVRAADGRYVRFEYGALKAWDWLATHAPEGEYQVYHWHQGRFCHAIDYDVRAGKAVPRPAGR